jgi:protein-disulfide isomerase
MLLIGTGIALVVAVVVIVFAVTQTNQPSAPVGTPMPPGITTPPDITHNDNVLGNPDAPVTLDVYSDYQCPRCFDFATGNEVKLIDAFVRTGKLKIAYHDYIVIDSKSETGSTESRDAANAALCAGDQGKYWTMHDWLFGNQSLTENSGAFTIDRLIQIGQMAGLNMTTFKPCVQNGKYESQIATEQTQVPSDAGGTPAFFIGGTQVNGPIDSSSGLPTIPSYDQIAAAINGVLYPSPSASPSASASASAGATTSAAPTSSASSSASSSPSSSASSSASAGASPTAAPTASPS